MKCSCHLTNSAACLLAIALAWEASPLLPFSAQNAWAAPPENESQTDGDKPASSIDQELLDSLGDDASDPLPPKPKGSSEDKDASDEAEQPADEMPDDTQPDASDDIDAELLRGLEEIDGPSTGAPGDERDPLSRITNRMRDVQRRIARARSGTDTQKLQGEIVGELDRLIEDLQKNANQSSSSSSGAQQGDQQAGQESGQQDSSAGQSGSQAARDSTARLSREKAAKPEPAGVRELMEGAWGRLPERVRQQMLQSSIEDFVPQYETLLREYFRSIATAGEK